MFETAVPLEPRKPNGKISVVAIGRISTPGQDVENIEASYRYVKEYLGRIYDGPMEIIRAMKDRAMRGDTYATVAEWLDAEGIEPGSHVESGRWAGRLVVDLLDDPRIPLDNNASERKVRGPALGRKNYYGSGALWSGRLSAMMFSILATLSHWRINPRHWLMWYLKTCAASGGKAPSDVSPFLPWNLTTDQLASLRAADPRADQPTA